MDRGDFLRHNRSILYNAMQLTLVNLLLRGISMLFQVYLTDQIGAAGLGLLQLVLSTGSLAMTLGLAGIRVAAMYLCAEEHGHRRPGGVKRAITLCLLCGVCTSTVAAALLYGFSAPIALHWVKDVRAGESLRVFALSLPLNCVLSILSGYFTACGKIRKLVLCEVVERLISLPLTYLLLRFWACGNTQHACSAMIAGSALASLVSAVWLFSLLRRDWPGLGRPARGLHLAARLRRLCVPLALSDALRAALATLEQFLIPHGLLRYSGSSAAAMEVYGVIHGMVFPILMVPAALLYALSDLLVPELARCNAVGERIRIRHLCSKCLRMGALFSACIAALMFTLSKPLAQLLYGSATAGDYLRQFAPMVLFLYLDALVDAMCKGLGQQIACVRFNTITSLLDVILLTVLLPRCGIRGYLISFILTHLINFYLSLRLLLRLTHLTPRVGFLLRVAVCVLAGLGASLCVPLLLPDLPYLFAACALFTAVFVPMTRLTGAVGMQERIWLRQMLPGH